VLPVPDVLHELDRAHCSVVLDGTWAVEMDELSLVACLAALVPPPWQNQVRYSGVLAPASQWRSRIVPKPAAEPTDAGQLGCSHDGLASEPDPSAQRTVPEGKGCRYWPWRLLKARTFGEPTTKCSHCDGELTLRAVVQDPDSIHRILSHLSPEPTHPPSTALRADEDHQRGPKTAPPSATLHSLPATRLATQGVSRIRSLTRRFARPASSACRGSCPAKLRTAKSSSSTSTFRTSTSR
jgi:hypothetical protein